MLKTCPTPDLLERLLADRLDKSLEDLIGEHVEECALCQGRLERLTEAAVEPGVPSPLAPMSGESAVVEELLVALKQEPPASVIAAGLLRTVRSRSGFVRSPCDRPAPDGYEILEELGRGGMGVVYKARHRRLGRIVALKMILDGAHAAPSELDRFRREAEAIARLQHPHIVQIFDLGEHDGRPYLALEFVEGGSLARLIRGAPLSPRRSAEIVRDLARTIADAHRAGIVHRDLNPANVLLTSSGVPKITDFGIAKRLDAEAAFPTITEQFLGTPSYIAPEQAVRERAATGKDGKRPGIDLSPAVDIYGLGAILYELVTGRPPFRGATPVETVLKVLHEDPVAPSRLRPNMPRDLETICLKCLEKLPQRRYATARELGEDLERFLDFEPVKARPVAAIERGWRWCRRKSSLALALGLAGVAILAVIALSIRLAVYHYQAASRLGEALHEVRSKRRQVDEQSAHLAYEHGQSLCEQGDVAQGMLWLARGMKSARLAGDVDLERAFRLNLSAWGVRIHTLHARAEHPGLIHAAAFSADGRTFAVAGDDDTVQVHDAATGEPIGPPLRHPAKVGALAYSPDGRTILTGCDDFVARLWDAETGSPLEVEFRHVGEVLAVAFGPDGRKVLTGSVDRTARLWDVATGASIGTPMPHEELITCVAFGPDGRTVATASWDRTARLWDAATGRPIGEPLRHKDWVSSVAYSPDGQMLLTGCYDRTARLWDANDRQPRGRPLRHQHCVRSVAFAPDGSRLITGSFDGTARIWDVESREPFGPPIRHQHIVEAVAFSPDGHRVLTAGRDKTALISEVARSSGLSFSHDDHIRAVLFSPDGKTIVSASKDHTARLWDAETGKPIGLPMQHGDVVEAIDFSPDGRLVLTGSQDHTARLWDARRGTPVAPPLRHEHRVRTVAFSPNGDRVLTGGDDNTARLWDVATGHPIGAPLLHGGWVRSVAFSPDGRRVVTGGDDRTARLWDAETGKPIGQPLRHGDNVMAVSFSPDGRTILTGSDDMNARLWDTASGKLRVHPLQHDGPVTVAAFSPDGKAIITGGWDRMVHIWDVRTGTSITPPLRHEGLLRALAISRDGRSLMTGSYDRTAQLWDRATGKPIGPALRHENQVWFVAFSPEGRTVLSGGQENTAHLWEVPRTVDIPIGRLERSLQIATGMELLDDGTLHILDSAGWNERRARTEEKVR
jgi:WD40 repeat protein/tRNA A-37 threonylcarbamoyl transferase component Bud32